MGPARGSRYQQSLQSATEELLHRSGYEVIYPYQLQEQCCGMPFNSKGFFTQAQQKADQTIAALMAATHQVRYRFTA